MTFKDVKSMFMDGDGWVLKDKNTGEAVYRNKYHVYLKFATEIRTVNRELVMDFTFLQWFIIKYFYRRSLRRYLERIY